MCYNFGMKITEFDKCGKNVKICVDGEFWKEIPFLIAFDYRLEKGMNVDSNLLGEIALKTEQEDAFNYAVKYLGKYSVTVKKMKNKLYEKEYTTPVVNGVLEKLLEFGYLDDYRFAESLINQKKNKLGSRRLQNELRLKGVPSDIISELLAEIDEDETFDTAMAVAEKWYRTHELETHEDYAKFTRFMAYRGFEFSIINACRDALKREAEND